MAITFDIASTEILMTTGQVTVTAQDLLNAIRLEEESFSMMSNDHIADASGKAPLGGAVFTEIILTLRNPWTIRFADEATQHTSVKGGTFLAVDAIGDPRVVTTNPSLTINQSVSGVLVEGSGSGLDPAQATQLDEIHELLGLNTGRPVSHLEGTPKKITSTNLDIDLTETAGDVVVQRN